jgi:glycosyltransferase involved in cell wall biosynthesis
MIKGRPEIRPEEALSLSAVLPLRNAVGSIRPALQFLTTTLDANGAGGWELLAVDDASTDGTAAAVLDLAREDPRILLLRNPARLGPGDAARHGILLARGARILLLNLPGLAMLPVLPRLERHLEEGQDLAVASQRIDWTRPIPPVRVRRAVLGRMLRPQGRFGGGDFDQEPLLHLYRRPPALEIFRRQKMSGGGYAFEALYLAQRYDYSALEVGVPRNGTPRPRRGVDSGASLSEILRIRIHRLRGDYG